MLETALYVRMLQLVAVLLAVFFAASNHFILTGVFVMIALFLGVLTMYWEVNAERGSQPRIDWKRGIIVDWAVCPALAISYFKGFLPHPHWLVLLVLAVIGFIIFGIELENFTRVHWLIAGVPSIIIATIALWAFYSTAQAWAIVVGPVLLVLTVASAVLARRLYKRVWPQAA